MIGGVGFGGDGEQKYHDVSNAKHGQGKIFRDRSRREIGFADFWVDVTARQNGSILSREIFLAHVSKIFGH
jgi:hypothetical protein